MCKTEIEFLITHRPFRSFHLSTSDMIPCNPRYYTKHNGLIIDIDLPNFGPNKQINYRLQEILFVLFLLFRVKFNILEIKVNQFQGLIQQILLRIAFDMHNFGSFNQRSCKSEVGGPVFIHDTFHFGE